MITVVPVLVPLLLGTLLLQPDPCPAVGALRLEPPGAVAGDRGRLIAEVDSPDARCRELVRSEPFVVLRSPRGELELLLRPDGPAFSTELTVPPPPWSATLYVVGTGDPLATVSSDGVTNLADLWQVGRRAPGALLIIATAVGLGLLAVLGLPSAPRQRRGKGQAVRRRARSRPTEQPVPPATDGSAEVATGALAIVDRLTAPATLTAEGPGSPKREQVRADETPDGEQRAQDAERREPHVSDVGRDGEDDGEQHQLARPTKPAPE